MGVINLYFVDHEVEVRCRLKVVDCAYIILSTGWFPTIGCTISTPDVSRP
jgi:hypothetical protein